tara:strand:+ start:12967 stop:13206 length:240 start_codon:yes stop_codon:yes gene_type:complete
MSKPVEAYTGQAVSGNQRKPAIPAVRVQDKTLFSLLYPMKQNIEDITGVRTGKIADLPVTATADDAIAKINEIINRLNF